VVAITHHQPPPVGVELISELLDVGGHLGLQRRGQHSTRALAHDLVYRRPRHTSLVGLGTTVDYLEHGTYLPAGAPTPDMIETMD
jgi:hypothetical protein